MKQQEDFRSAAQKTVEVADGLNKMARIVETLGDDPAIGKLADAMRERATALCNDRFSIFVVGGFSRGKSTLLNAILGTDILPQKMIPSTAIITVLEYADQPCARVRYVDRHTPEDVLSLEEFRRRFVLNEKDSVNGKMTTDRFSHIDYATIAYPVELCRYRVELIDSPGLKDDPVRTKRTRAFLKKADAIVMVLDAQDLLDQDEREFLETVLLPEGLHNIFFVINKWNLVEQSVMTPEDAEEAFADLEARIHNHLVPFCVVDGQDRSPERIFRVNALGALKAQMRTPPLVAMLEESNIPAFEAALQRFLIEERRRVKNEVIRHAVKSTTDAVHRFMAAQYALGKKSVEEIEAELTALQPKLDRLRGIRQHIVNFLDNQSNRLQDGLVHSLQTHIHQKILPTLETEVEKLDLSEAIGWSVTWKALTDRWRAEEDRLAEQLKRSIEPQVKRWLHREFVSWRQSVVQNEIAAVQIDVDKHLQAEAAEYRRVLHAIEDQLGVHGSVINIDELIKSWLRKPNGDPGTGAFDLSGIGALGDLGWLIGGIAADIAAEVVLHMSVVWLPLVGLVFSAIRMVMREFTLRGRIKTNVTEGIRRGLILSISTEGEKIRTQVRESFDTLKATVTGNIDEQIALIEASWQSILDRKRAEEFSVEETRQRLEAANADLDAVVAQISAALAV
jgi:small GTP-binding protein